MLYGYLRKIHPGRRVVLRQIRTVIFGTTVSAAFGVHNASAFVIPSPAIIPGSQHVAD